LELDENGQVIIFGTKQDEKIPEPSSDAQQQSNEELNPKFLKKSPTKQIEILINALRREKYNVYELITKKNVL